MIQVLIFGKCGAGKTSICRKLERTKLNEQPKETEAEESNLLITDTPGFIDYDHFENKVKVQLQKILEAVRGDLNIIFAVEAQTQKLDNGQKSCLLFLQKYLGNTAFDNLIVVITQLNKPKQSLTLETINKYKSQ